MPNTRTLADLWGSLGIDERLLIFLERYHAETPPSPSTLRSHGYRDAIADLEFYILDRHPLPGEDAN